MVSASWCFYCAGTGFGYAGRVLSDGLCAGEGLAACGVGCLPVFGTVVRRSAGGWVSVRGLP
ncbi:MAG: hypothetical protein D8H97_15780 [Neisseria sp.]|nr:MAG: hypothetical protein D8H97_15780 [Neisseria sp.]